MGKKTNGAANDNAAAAKEPSAATAKRTKAKNDAVKPARKRLTIAKVVKAGAIVAVAAGQAIARKARAARSKRKATPRTRVGSPSNSRIPYTREEVALRAYFISERRRAEGFAGDPDHDWIEAERQLAQEHF